MGTERVRMVDTTATTATTVVNTGDHGAPHRGLRRQDARSDISAQRINPPTERRVASRSCCDRIVTVIKVALAVGAAVSMVLGLLSLLAQYNVLSASWAVTSESWQAWGLAGGGLFVEVVLLVLCCKNRKSIHPEKIDVEPVMNPASNLNPTEERSGGGSGAAPNPTGSAISVTVTDNADADNWA